MTDIQEPSAPVEDKPLHLRDHVPLNNAVFGISAALSVAFVIAGAVWPDDVLRETGEALGWVTRNFGWLFILTSAAFLVFSAYLAVTRYGNIKLGPDDSEPEFSTFSWVSMMFATGMGIGLMFWGVAEPLTHLNAPPLGDGEGGTAASAEMAMQYTYFHWGFHPWAMYAVIGLAIGYFAYRKGYGNTISATFRPLLGKRASEGPGKAIDIIAIFATLFGSATSLGLGALQITGGIDDVFDRGAGSEALAVAVIAVLTLCFVLSAVSGVDKGIQFLSNANAIAAGLLVFFLFVVGPTVFIMGTFTTSMGDYLTHLPTMAFNTGVYDGEAQSWLGGWTIFYWAWWMSWTPFVGMFIARISKGRTIRQFVIYVILVPSLVSFIWFAILGGSALNLQLNEGWSPPTIDGAVDSQGSLFAVLREYPVGGVLVGIAVFLIAIFFITGADAASIVMGMLSQNGTEEPKRWLVVFWGVATGAVAAVLLWAGAPNGLSALQTLVILVAFPFMLILIGMCVSLAKSLREETFESTLPSRVRRAVEHSQRFPDGP